MPSKANKIAAVALPGTFTEARGVIDATGKVVVPGGVESHLHAAMPGAVNIWGVQTAGGVGITAFT